MPGVDVPRPGSAIPEYPRNEYWLREELTKILENEVPEYRLPTCVGRVMAKLKERMENTALARAITYESHPQPGMELTAKYIATQWMKEADREIYQ